MLSTNKIKEPIMQKGGAFHKKIIFIFSFIFFLGLLILLFLLPNKNSSFQQPLPSQTFSNSRLILVQGDSMAPLIPDGSQVKVIEDYYLANSVKSDELVLYRYGGKDLPLVKIVKGVSGDAWGLKKNGDYYNIIVNGKTLKNSEDKPYQIKESKSAMLQLYATTYPVIPLDSYLILGDRIDGTLDSTAFGLVHKDDFVGKALK